MAVMDIRPVRMGVDLRFMPVVMVVGLFRPHAVVRVVMVHVGMVMLVLVLQRLMGVVMDVSIPEQDHQ